MLLAVSLALSPACGGDSEDGAGGAQSESRSGKAFAAVCDRTSVGGTVGSCDEYFSDDPDFRIPYTVSCVNGTKRCPTAKVVGTCILSPQERGVEPFDHYKHYYNSADYHEEDCEKDGGEWIEE